MDCGQNYFLGPCLKALTTWLSEIQRLVEERATLWVQIVISAVYQQVKIVKHLMARYRVTLSLCHSNVSIFWYFAQHILLSNPIKYNNLQRHNIQQISHGSCHWGNLSILCHLWPHFLSPQLFGAVTIKLMARTHFCSRHTFIL